LISTNYTTGNNAQLLHSHNRITQGNGSARNVHNRSNSISENGRGYKFAHEIEKTSRLEAESGKRNAGQGFQHNKTGQLGEKIISDSKNVVDPNVLMKMIDQMGGSGQYTGPGRVVNFLI